MSFIPASRLLKPTTIISTAALTGLGITMCAQYLTSDGEAQSREPKKIFPGGFANIGLPLESSEDVNHNTKRLRFRLPEPDAISGLPLTSAVLTCSWPEGRWLPTLRPYTPINHSDEPGVLELLVKKYPNGKASTYIHSLKPGDSLRFLVTVKGFAWTPNMYPHVTLIAGGAGITPVYQLIQGILSNPLDQTKITLVYGVNTDADVLLKKEFDEFAIKHPGRFQAMYTVSRPAADSKLRSGYVTKELLQEVIPTENTTDKTKVFVCGPPAMEDALLGSLRTPGILAQLGYDKKKVHKF